ncbi:MAG: glucose-1-phosphate adenylyltransferase [Candidatus Saccharimonas sp.]|nr:glucose-1-phosphate adenylyltransferase [Planctomycetaceae bacterium]
MKHVLSLILAGGKGSRLDPLTRDRAKPAVPFGGAYRIIDFTLSNCINSGLRKVLVLTQYKAVSLDRHISLGWRFLCRELDEYIDILPPQQRLHENWYKGTADAVYQNIYSIEQCQSDYLLILAGDHIYKMDYSALIQDHMESGAALTIGCIPCSLKEGSEFGIMQVDSDRRIIEFQEKPSEPKPMPDDPTRCLASMGIYVFNTNLLFERLIADAADTKSSHDFGKNIIPSLIDSHLVRAFPFRDKNTGVSHYWRDVGTLDAFYEANMDLITVDPQLNLYDTSWPLRSYQPHCPPPKFVFALMMEEPTPRVGHALDSLVCAGSIISGGTVRRSVLGYNVRVNSWATVEDSILFDGVVIGRRARVRRAIIDKQVRIPEGASIGFDHDADRARGYVVTESGVVVIGKSED